MEVEIEELAKLLFPNEIPELWKDSEEFSKYIVHLSSCGVERLGKEGAHLREERLAILDQTRDLAYSNYKTFIHTAECSRTIFKDFTSVETHLEGLSSCLPGLRGSVEQFLATSRSLSQSRHLTSLTLTKHTQLLEVLELPQLMDTCVRNGYYDEALEILAYVRRLERKHTDIHIINGIVTEVQSGTRLMLNQLLAQLRSPLALPQCLKVIGLLRRLDVFTEPELRLKFLQARDAWFTGILKNIPKEDPYQHVIKVVEASRVHLFDIVTQYRAIFSDDDSRFGLCDYEINEQAIFYGWILHKVNHFIKLVKKDLECGLGSNLESVLAQCMFFGQSFSRIGADFRNLLIPLFQKAALVQYEKDVRVANIRFDETLSSFSLMEAPHMSISSAYMTETQDKTRPPLTLMEFPPLAHYMNGLIAAFNTLRQCCPVSSLSEVIRLLNQSLTKVIGALLELHRLESSGFTVKEAAAFQRLCSVVADGVLPHINSCLRLLFPLQQMSHITGEPVAKLQRENFGQLDIENLLSPIASLLPKNDSLPSNTDLEQDVISSSTNITEHSELPKTEKQTNHSIDASAMSEEPVQSVPSQVILPEKDVIPEKENLLTNAAEEIDAKITSLQEEHLLTDAAKEIDTKITSLQEKQLLTDAAEEIDANITSLQEEHLLTDAAKEIDANITSLQEEHLLIDAAKEIDANITSLQDEHLLTDAAKEIDAKVTSLQDEQLVSSEQSDGLKTSADNDTVLVESSPDMIVQDMEHFQIEKNDLLPTPQPHPPSVSDQAEKVLLQ